MNKTPLPLDTTPQACRNCSAWNKVLLVAQARDNAQAAERVLRDIGCQLEIVSASPEALSGLRDHDVEIAVWWRQRAEADDLDGIRALRRQCPQLPIIVVGREIGSDMAIELMKAGASDLIAEPYAPEQLQALVQRSIKSRQMMCEAVLLPTGVERDVPACRLIGNSRPMQEVYKQIGLVAEREEPVLILGETGTGKELVARAIYFHSLRRDRPFLPINCAALPDTLLESELFGYEKGAFTGAVHRRAGLFEQAHRGTIFLDEIGDMPVHLQSKILRVAQTGEFQRLGSQELMRADVRILAATHQNLEQGIEAGTFREDLYYRLNVVTLRLPPLRDHKEDLLDLAEYFISRYTPPGQPRPALSADALHQLEAYSWPGNIRELENTIRRGLVAARGHAILSKDICLGEPIAPSSPPDFANTAPFQEQLDRLLERWLQQSPEGQADLLTLLDNHLIQAALRLTDGNQAQAAKWLGISRTTLRSHLKQAPV